MLCYRHVSVTMKNYRPEMVLGGTPQSPVTEGGLAIRVGSFSGKPITPKSRRAGSNLGPAAGGAEPLGSKSKATYSKVCIAVKYSQCNPGARHQTLDCDPLCPCCNGVAVSHFNAASQMNAPCI